MIYKNLKYKIDGVTFETETINSDYKIISIYIYWHPLGCFWLTNNQSEYLRRKIAGGCNLKDIFTVCEILNRKNESWEYILNTVK